MSEIAGAAVMCTLIICITIYNSWSRWLDYRAARDEAERTGQEVE